MKISASDLLPMDSDHEQICNLRYVISFIPHICQGRHGQRPCKFFLPGVNFYRFNVKNWQFTV